MQASKSKQASKQAIRHAQASGLAQRFEASTSLSGCQGLVREGELTREGPADREVGSRAAAAV